MKKSLGLLLCASVLYSDIVVFGDDYNIASSKEANVDFIFTNSQQKEAQLANFLEAKIIKDYEKSYGYALDDKLYLGILSHHNQVPNAFSTQFPFNMQMNYIGGAYMVDYMTTTSWLKTILIHESAHNFQINPKKNRVSQIAHKIVKNTPVTSLLFLPIFPVPNALESSFMLEGNAVLNESRFGNGGRLYNGGLLAMTITQARAGYITPERTYNSHLYFPYGTHHYIVGGFFQLFLAEKYGVDKTNRYFWNFSGQHFPVHTNKIFKETFGKNFKEELQLYVRWLSDKYGAFKVSEGEFIASSKSHAKLNSDEEEIYFLASDAVSKPKLHRLSKVDGKDRISSDTYMFGKVFNVEGRYVSSSSSDTDVNRIELGLFDKDGKLLQESRSKVIQRILNDGEFLYFDVNQSFDTPALYKGDEFLGHVNSSAFSDDSDNIYYFKQSGKKRTLYKNKTPIFSFLGWYGFVVDVDEKGIYFIANSENGSTLYSYQQGQIYRLSQGDDIVDAKLLDAKTLLLTTITGEGYNYIKAPIHKYPSSVFNRTYFFEKDSLENGYSSFDDVKKYESYKQMHFSALNQSFVATEDAIDFSIGAKFTDPLAQNSVNLFISRFDEETLAGVGYLNSTYRLRYGADIYGVLEKDSTISSRDFGLNLSANYPLYRHGYKSLDISANYHLDHDRDEREPLGLVLNYSDTRRFGMSMYTNYGQQTSLFAVSERSDMVAGASYEFAHALGNEFYMSSAIKYAQSNTDKSKGNYGVKVDDSLYTLREDPSQILMPSLQSELYAQDVLKAGVSLYKVLNFNHYNFRIPVSLRRESVYARCNYYDMTLLDDRREDFWEYVAGAKFDLLFLYKNPIPFTLEYLYNDKLQDSSRVRFLFDMPF